MTFRLRGLGGCGRMGNADGCEDGGGGTVADGEGIESAERRL